MLHEEFAGRVAGRLESAAEELEQDDQRVGQYAAEVRARMLRLAADVALDEAATVTREEAPPPAAQA